MYTRVLQGRNTFIKVWIVTDDDDDDDDGSPAIVRRSSDRPSLYEHQDKSERLYDKWN